MTKSWVIAMAGAAALVLAGVLLLSSRDQTKSVLTPPVLPTTVRCDLTLGSGVELGTYLNDSAYAREVICLSGGDYTLTRPQHTPGVKVYALHPARVWGWIEAYGAGEEWHGVSFDNCSGFVTQPGSCSNPGQAGDAQAMQVYADNFVFVDGEVTNAHTAGGWVLGRSGAPVRNVLIARNKIHDVGRFPGGTGADHAFYADNASGQVTDNWLWGNVGYGLQFYPYSSELHFDHNVIDRQQEACVVFGSRGSGNTFEHNICVLNRSGVMTCCGNVPGSRAGHNWFWGVLTPYGGGDYSRLGGDGVGDPGFVDYARHDYRLVGGAAAAG
jgi:hypothetical protein